MPDCVGYASAQLYCAVVVFVVILVEKKAVDTCFYINTETVSTWSHVGHVEKNQYPTPKQTLKSNATAKWSFFLLQSCGKFKTAEPT
ncbi:MAG: hypothetical protein M1167_02130 [Chloroflexi bacterium]|nr:hypothetical protein [Chloroflexota bacterium]